MWLSCLVLLLGMYVSRAFMSIGMMGMLAAAFLPDGVKPAWKTLWHQPHIWLIMLYWVLMAFTFFWSEDHAFFFQRIQIILPFLALPLAFFRVPTWDSKKMDGLFFISILLNLIGELWSLFTYLGDKSNYDAAYGVSHLIPTPFQDDHIRFSIAVVLSICLALDLLIRYKQLTLRLVLGSIILFDITYLHILSAKTGILGFYLVCLLLLVKLIRTPKFRRWGLGLGLVVIMLPVLMYSVSASLRIKIKYIIYSVERMQNKTKEVNVSDEGRLISYDYALTSIRRHPWMGVGLGDVMNEMKVFYDRDFPGVKLKVLLPHNQFLMSGMAAGVGAIFLLVVILFFLWKKRRRCDLLFVAYWAIMLFAMMIEPLFETQYGTCMFLFFLLLLLHRQNNKEVLG